MARDDSDGAGAEVDVDLLSRAVAGEVEAFGRFFDRHAADVLGWFRVRTAAGDVAADLCAETFAEALAGLRRFDPSLGEARAWLFGIARNQFRHWLRRQRVERRARHRLGIRVDIPHEDDLDFVELRADLDRRLGHLHDALDALPDTQRRAVLLRVVEELPYAQVAERLGCSEGAARVRVCRGLASLLDELAPEVTG